MDDERPDLVPLGEAAERLALSTEAVRKRIQRGTLVGEKVGGAWFVRADQLPPAAASSSAGRPDAGVETASGRQDGTDRTAGPSTDGVLTGGRSGPEPAAVDLVPLADLIERLTRANQDLAASAAMWQERARVLEGRLLALGAGDEARGDGQEAPVAQPQPPGAAEPPRPASETLMLRWRRWWRRMTEGP